MILRADALDHSDADCLVTVSITRLS